MGSWEAGRDAELSNWFHSAETRGEKTCLDTESYHIWSSCVFVCVCARLSFPLSLLTLISSTLSFKYLYVSPPDLVSFSSRVSVRMNLCMTEITHLCVCLFARSNSTFLSLAYWGPCLIIFKLFFYNNKVYLMLAQSHWRTVREVANAFFVMKGTLQILQTVFVIFFSWFPRKCPAAGQWAKRSGKEMQIFCTSFTYVTTVSVCICQSLFIFVCFSTDTYYRQMTHNKRPTGGGKDNERRSV